MDAASWALLIVVAGCAVALSALSVAGPRGRRAKAAGTPPPSPEPTRGMASPGNDASRLRRSRGTPARGGSPGPGRGEAGVPGWREESWASAGRRRDWEEARDAARAGGTPEGAGGDAGRPTREGGA